MTYTVPKLRVASTKSIFSMSGFYFLTILLLAVQEIKVVETLARVYVESTRVGKSAKRWSQAGALIEA